MEFIGVGIVIILAIIIGWMYYQLLKENKQLREQVAIPEDFAPSISIYIGANNDSANATITELLKVGKDVGNIVQREIPTKFGRTLEMSNGANIEVIETTRIKDKDKVVDYRSQSAFIDLSIDPKILVEIVHMHRNRYVYFFDENSKEKGYLEYAD